MMMHCSVVSCGGGAAAVTRPAGRPQHRKRVSRSRESPEMCGRQNEAVGNRSLGSPGPRRLPWTPIPPKWRMRTLRSGRERGKARGGREESVTRSSQGDRSLIRNKRSILVGAAASGHSPRGSVYFFLGVPIAISILPGCPPACGTAKKTCHITLGMTWCRT